MSKKHNGLLWRVLKIWATCLILAFCVLGVIAVKRVGVPVVTMYREASKDVAKSSKDTFKAEQTSLVYDAEGNEIKKLKQEKDVSYLDYEDIPDEISITDAENAYNLLHVDNQAQTLNAKTNENNKASSLEDFEDYFNIEEDDNIPIYDTEEMPVSEIIKKHNEQYHKTNDLDILPPEQKLKNQIKPKNGRPDGTNVKQKQSFFGRFFKK